MEIVDSTFQAGAVRSLASVDRTRNRLVVWLVNCDERPTTATVTIAGTTLRRATAAWQFTGTDAQDEKPETLSVTPPPARRDGFQVTLPSCSASAFQFEIEPSA